MTRLDWDKVGERFYETGVDRGVLYIPENGVYSEGVAWNGLTTVTESPSGAEASPQYADNIKYLNLISNEELGATIEAYTYPPEFAQFDGAVVLNGGVALGQQARKSFGLSYRTRKGNDIAGSEFGYKLHLLYGAQAAPSERAFASINDSPEAITFSWAITTTAVPVTGQRPTALLTIDSTNVPAENLAALENVLYGTAGTDPRLPLPDEVIAMFAGTLTVASPMTTPPTYDAGTRTVTLPPTTGIQWRVNGVVQTGTFVVPVGQFAVVKAVALPTYRLPDITQDTWVFGPAA